MASGLLPENASLHGRLVDSLLHFAHVGDAVLLSCVVGTVLVAVLGARRTAAVAMNGERWQAQAGVVALALMAFLALDGVLFLGSLRYVDSAVRSWTQADADPRAVRIEVDAQQWAWSMRYPGPDGAFNTPDDVLTLDALHVPVGRPVVLELASVDVVHDFALPHLRVKMDVVPGHITRLWFQAERSGTFEIVCSQFCGASHYQMRGVLTAESPEAFEAWLHERSVLSASAYDPADSAAHWGWTWRAQTP